MAACSVEMQNEEKFEVMLRRIARSDVVVRSQQKDEPDLTEDEKYDVLKGIYLKSPCTFLMRFGKSFAHEDLECFDELKGDYEIDFYLREVRKYLDTKKRKTGVANRRYECMQRLVKESDFFSEEEMRKRCPWMYEQYIGQYLTEEEKFNRDQSQMGADPSLQEFLFNRLDRDITKFVCEYQKECEESQQEEEEEDSDSEVEEEIAGSPFKGVPTEDERQMLRMEFEHIMQERFMEGEDKDFFDYSTVDSNEEFDDLKVRAQDEEEAYFDQEEPGSDCKGFGVDTEMRKEKE